MKIQNINMGTQDFERLRKLVDGRPNELFARDIDWEFDPPHHGYKILKCGDVVSLRAGNVVAKITS